MISAKEKSILNAINELNDGWAIYSVIGGIDDGAFHIEKNDDMNVFTSDSEAIKYVYSMALQGSKIHAEALEFMNRYATATEKMFMHQAIVNH